MSAQIIRALRKRADDLETYARQRLAEGSGDEQDLTVDGKYMPGRSPRFMLMLATEYRLLANEAEELPKPPFEEMKSQSAMWNELHPDDPVMGVEYRKMAGAVYRTKSGRQLSQDEFEHELGL